MKLQKVLLNVIMLLYRLALLCIVTSLQWDVCIVFNNPFGWSSQFIDFASWRFSQYRLLLHIDFSLKYV